MQQKYTSRNTSVNSTKLPAIYGRINWHKVRTEWYKTHNLLSTPYVVDIGCGRYTANIKNYLSQYGIGYLGHDPYWGSDEGWDKVVPALIICSNVLNVIEEDDNIDSLIETIQGYNRPYYITVYEGNGSGIGKVTKKDCYQRNAKAASYCKGNQIVYKNTITEPDYKVFLEK